MYQQSLTELPGMANMVTLPQPCPNAVDFARWLITLPVHGGVRKQHRERTQEIFQAHMPERDTP